MAMAPPRLLRDLIAPLSPSPADWLPCHQQLLTSAALLHRCWLPSLWRLQCPDGFKLFIVLPLVSAALAEVRYVSSASMAPTLRPVDRAVAEKVSYMFRRPSVGDIVFFRVPKALQNCGINKDVMFIKRVIATPGDFIEVRQGQLIVNGVAQNEHYTAPHASYTMEAMVCCISLNNIEELLLPGPEILVCPNYHGSLLLDKQMTILLLQEEDQKWHGCSVLMTS